MNISTVNELASSPHNAFNAKMEQPDTKFTKKLWIDTRSMQTPNVLDPDDSLMKKFQNALREHLVRVDDRLNGEILELVSIGI